MTEELRKAFDSPGAPSNVDGGVFTVCCTHTSRAALNHDRLSQESKELRE
jgi:hypothetical protein